MGFFANSWLQPVEYILCQALTDDWSVCPCVAPVGLDSAMFVSRKDGDGDVPDNYWSRKIPFIPPMSRHRMLWWVPLSAWMRGEGGMQPS